MNLLVTTENHFHRTPDGAVWTKTMFTHGYWKQYLNIFQHVRVVARVCDIPMVASDWHRVDGEGVSLAPVPDYLGPSQYLLRASQVRRATRRAFCPGDAVILYHGQITSCIEPLLRRIGYPYAMYVIGDPYDVYAPGTITHPLRPFFQWWFPRRLRRQCASACAVAYVSKEHLHHRYPPAAGSLSTYFVMQGLSGDWFVNAPRQPRREVQRFTLICVGSLAQLYKGPDTLIDAVAVCVREGIDLRLILVGEGKYRKDLEARVATQGLEQRVCFRGQLASGAAVRAELDQADLFVMPSRTEGLPLAFIEAMARALPCIGSTVGGIPEFLPPEDMVPPGDVLALARKIREVVTDPGRMARMSARNLEEAKEYKDDIIYERKNMFYCYLRDRTEEWLQIQGRL